MEPLGRFVSIVKSKTGVVIVGRQSWNSSVWHLFLHELIVICSFNYLEISRLLKIPTKFERGTLLKFVELVARVLNLLLLVLFISYLLEASRTRCLDSKLIFAERFQPQGKHDTDNGSRNLHSFLEFHTIRRLNRLLVVLIAVRILFNQLIQFLHKLRAIHFNGYTD